VVVIPVATFWIEIVARGIIRPEGSDMVPERFPPDT
jgi:hypothetical protein